MDTHRFHVWSVACTLTFLCFAKSPLQGKPPQGQVVVWGDNRFNQAETSPDLTNITAVAGGYFHNLALRADGTVVAWGINGGTNDFGQSLVPEGIFGVTAIAAGAYHNVILKSEGTVFAWGRNDFAQCTVPEGLSNVMAIAAGVAHTLALLRDGTVIAWGDPFYGQTAVPPDLANVTAISCGAEHSLALKGDGTVVAWGWNNFGQTDVPPDLNNVVSISAGGWHNLVVKSDASVVGWGYSYDGQATAPVGLSNVVKVAGGNSHSMALMANGKVVAWGWNGYGQTNVAEDLNAFAIAAGLNHCLALRPVGTTPRITEHPINLTVCTGSNATFTVTATGTAPLGYQWQFASNNVVGATNTLLLLEAVDPTRTGDYRVIVSNAYGIAVSSNAFLTVLMPQPAFQPKSLARSNNRFQFSVMGEVGRRFEIQLSSNLTVWTTLCTVTNSCGVVPVVDEVPDPRQRWYRVRQLSP
jgi:alpha-tubulin suppressor-like RCC1 family protein